MNFRRIQFLFLLLLLCVYGFGQSDLNFEQVIGYRNFAPHKAGSWISDIAVPESIDLKNKYTFYVAGRNGGVWKTINNGTTFFPIFDELGVSSIGAIALSKSQPEHLWVGTGEAYNARSSHKGNGVYFSPDGGNNWSAKGLEDTHHISEVIVHPSDPNQVYVAAMGHLFTPNKMRGVFKTNDGGLSWNQVLFINENTGIIDMVMDPKNPEVIYAAAYEKYRYPWHYEAGGVSSGIYKTTNGGADWIKLKNGLPEGKLGRIGIALCYNRPNIVYAVIENLNPKPGIIVDENIQMSHLRDPYYDQLIGGEVYRSDDSGAQWIKQNNDGYNVSSKAAYSFNKIMVDPDNPDRISITSDFMQTSLNGGKSWLGNNGQKRKYFVNMFGDFRCMWVNPKDGNHMMIGSDGGLYITWDGGLHMKHFYNIPLGEIYNVEYDDAFPYNIYMGLQDHEAWKAPVNSWSGRIGSEDWSLYGMWDGMYTCVDHTDNRWVYITTQFGGHQRVDQLLGKRVNIEPKAEKNEAPYRFPWTPPIMISPHNEDVLYTGGQYLFMSKNKGDHWKKISPDLTTNDAKKIAGKGHMMYCSITSISESPIKSGVIWVGTDDGRVHLTKNQGKDWIEMTQKINDLGGNEDYWVSRVVASMHDPAVAYVCKSGYRNDDFKPLIFKTDDYGKSWEKITNGISMVPVNVVCEDPLNADLLYVGNDEGVFVSFNQGHDWIPFNFNMPKVPVKDLKINPKELDLIVGTYGRGAYVTDISLLNQLNDQALSADAHLFDVEAKPITNYSERAMWGNYELSGDSHLATPNETNGFKVYSYFKNVPNENSKIQLIGSHDEVIEEQTFNKNKGLQLNYFETRNLSPGSYLIRLLYDNKKIEKMAEVTETADAPIGKI